MKTETRELFVEGMTCDGCVRRVRRAVEAVEGVATVEVELPTGRVVVEGAGDVPRSALVQAIERTGYVVRAEGGAS